MSKIIIKDLELMQDLDSETATSCMGGNYWQSIYNEKFANKPSDSNLRPDIVFMGEPFVIEDPDSFFSGG